MYQDLCSEGVVGLIKATQRYVPGDAKFSTYAYIRIKGSILNYLRLREPIFPNMKKKEEALGQPIIVSLEPTKEEDSGQQRDIPADEQGYTFKETLAVIKDILTEQEFKIVMLKYQGFKQAEISKRMNLPEKSIREIMVSVRERLGPVLFTSD